MIYVYLKDGVLFFDSDLFDFTVFGELIYIFNDRVLVASFKKDFTKIVIDGDHEEIIYKGEKYNEE